MYEVTRNKTGSMLATSQLLVQLTQRDTGRGQERYCMHYVITRVHTKYYIGGFYLAVLTSTAKPPNLISRQISGYAVYQNLATNWYKVSSHSSGSEMLSIFLRPSQFPCSDFPPRCEEHADEVQPSEGRLCQAGLTSLAHCGTASHSGRG